MKLHLLALLALVPAAFAQTPALSLAEQVVEAAGVQAGMEASFMQGMDSAMQQFKKTGGDELAKSATEVMRKFFAENFKWEDVRPIYGQTYASAYSEGELKELLAFYQSPIGKKVAEKTSTLGIETSKVMSEKLKDKMPKLQTEMMKVVREHMEKAQKATK